MVTARRLCVGADGGLTRLELRGRRFSYGGRVHVLSVVRDVTERERSLRLLEQKVAERTRELSTLLEISNTVASNLQLKPLLARGAGAAADRARLHGRHHLRRSRATSW